MARRRKICISLGKFDPLRQFQLAGGGGCIVKSSANGLAWRKAPRSVDALSEQILLPDFQPCRPSRLLSFAGGLPGGRGRNSPVDADAVENKRPAAGGGHCQGDQN